jgi:transcriptional regulator with XRE-family HTH domain
MDGSSSKDTSGSGGQSLAEYLRYLRTAKKHTLRDVEEAAGVSNAYVSQLEQGKITKPSPHILHKLATFYQIPYESLMEKAGYITRAPAGKKAGVGLRSVRSGQLATSALSGVSSEEEEELLKYLAFLRSQRKGKE